MGYCLICEKKIDDKYLYCYAHRDCVKKPHYYEAAGIMHKIESKKHEYKSRR
jgi:hypothetical protein